MWEFVIGLCWIDGTPGVHGSIKETWIASCGGMRERERGTHVNRHLDARLSTSTFEHDVKPIGHVKVRKSSTNSILCTPQLVICRLGLLCQWQAVRFLSESLFLCKVQSLLVDVDGDDVGGAV